MQRGRPRKPVEQHILNGTYRPGRHGPRPPVMLVLPCEYCGTGLKAESSTVERGRRHGWVFVCESCFEEAQGGQHGAA